MDDRITFRCDEDLRDRFDDVGDRYDMTEAQLGRLLTKHGLTIIEEDGLDAFVETATSTTADA